MVNTKQTDEEKLKLAELAHKFTRMDKVIADQVQVCRQIIDILQHYLEAQQQRLQQQMVDNDGQVNKLLGQCNELAASLRKHVFQGSPNRATIGEYLEKTIKLSNQINKTNENKVPNHDIYNFDEFAIKHSSATKEELASAMTTLASKLKQLGGDLLKSLGECLATVKKSINNITDNFKSALKGDKEANNAVDDTIQEDKDAGKSTSLNQ